MIHVINLFCPRFNNKNHPDHNKEPENCSFPIDSGESVLCSNCNQQSKKLYKTALCQIEFPEPDVQNYVKFKM